jgi:hypothetical protein
MTTYETLIIADTGCTFADASLIEDIMRNEVFHSTLDWQSGTQFRQGARRAARILEENREMFEEFRNKTLAAFDEMKRAQK